MHWNIHNRTTWMVIMTVLLSNVSISAFTGANDSIRTLEQAKAVFLDNLVSEKDLSRSIMALDVIAELEKSDTVVKYSALALSRYAWLLAGKNGGDASLPLFRRVLEYCTSEDSVLYYDALSGMGGVYLAKGETNRAIDIARKSMRYHSSVKDTLGLLKAYTNMASLYNGANKPSAAKPYALKALHLAEQTHFYEYQGYILTLLSRLENDLDEKERWLALSDSIINAHDLKSLASENCLMRARMSLSSNDYEAALKYADQCISLATQYSQGTYIINALKLKAHAFSRLNDWQQAYFFLNLADEKEEANQAENEAGIASRTHFASLLMDWCDNHIVKSGGYYVSRNYSRTIWIVAVVTMTIIVVSIWWLWISKSRRRGDDGAVAVRLGELNKEIKSLEEKNDSLTRTVRYLKFFYDNQNALLNKIKMMSKGGITKEGEAANSLRKIGAFVTSNMLGPMPECHAVHSDDDNERFLQRLTVSFPDVTETEKRLATYIRAGLSTREICIITGNLPRSVNMTRHRLRQSIQLSEEENLDLFIKNL